MKQPAKATAKASGPAAPEQDAPAELVAENDAIVNRALWWSLAAVTAAALAGGFVWLAFFREVPQVAPPLTTAVGATGEPPRAADPPDVPFVDVTEESGISFVHQSGNRGEVLFPEIMGGGVAVFDYNSDGRLDLLFLNETHWPGTAEAEQAENQPLPALYRNEGEWRFTDVTREAGLDISFYGMGVACGDYDNDGDTDLYLTAVGECRLLRNEAGVFTDVTQAAGVAGPRDAWTTSAGWFDYDLDGDLDLFACSYVQWSLQMNLARSFRPQGGVRGSLSPQSFDGSVVRLYRNEGEGLFSDVSQAAGLEIVNDDTTAPVAKALGVCFADLNGDEWPDILVANDTVRNFAFLNQKDGKFMERGRELRVAFGPYGEARQGMGMDVADFRNDGTQGIAIGNFAGEMTALFVSSKGTSGQFSDEAIAAGIGAPTRPLLTFGLFFFDYDLDGWLDLLAANGHTEPNIAKVVSSQTYAQPAQLFWNCGRTGEVDFAEVTADDSGKDLFQPIVGRGAAYGDLDDDGDLDVVLTGIGTRPLILKNDQQLGHHWVRLRLVGGTANRDAIGARVELKVAGIWQRQVVSPAKSYLSACEQTLTFGLGKHEAIEEARIVWPGGDVQPLEGLAIDQLTVVEQAAEE
jgi:hypothetical protein